MINLFEVLVVYTGFLDMYGRNVVKWFWCCNVISEPKTQQKKKERVVM